ncbi:MAG: imidazole glycerol phosphate synthase subunit HisH, partial [Nocardioides sp.]
MSSTVVVLDYGSGNLRSAVRALERAGAEVTLTADVDAGLAADGLVVPGVGAYAACMAGLRAVRGDRLIGRRLAGGRPVLGICVGMQVLFARGVEHGVETAGCDEWPGVVERIQAPVVPHMGWNTVEVPDGTSLFAG